MTLHSLTPLADALPRYGQHLTAIGKAGPTVSAYLRDLRGIAQAANNPPLASLDSAALDAIFADPAFLLAEDGTPKAPATVNRAKAAMRAFLQWTASEGITPAALHTSIRRKLVPSATPTFLNDAELTALLKSLKVQFDDESPRDRAIVETFIGTGMRVAELLALDVDDLDLDGKHLRIKSAKGGAPQVKFLKTDLRQTLRTYLKWRKKHAPAGTTALFFSTRGERFSPRGLQYIVTRACQRAGITKDVSPHALRHTHATQLLAKTGNIRLVQKSLGHKSISTTQVYTHLVDCELADALETL